MCNFILEPVECSPVNQWALEQLLGTATEAAAGSAWESIVVSFAEAAVQMLHSFAMAFAELPNVDLTNSGIQSVYGMSLGIGFVVAALLLLFQAARTAITADGRSLAQGLVGVGKAVVAFLVTLTVASTALIAADELTVWIVNESFGSADGLQENLVALFEWDPEVSLALVLVVSIVGVILVAVLWLQLLLRNAALAVLIATSPIAAAGQVSGSTKAWWSKLVSATVQLIILKPVIALVFAIGFGMIGGETGTQGGLGTILSGLLVLLLAAIAWPAIARFMPFAGATMAGAAGGGGALGMASSAASRGTAGVHPGGFASMAESRTMATAATRAGGTAGASKGLAGVAGPIGAAIAGGLIVAQKTANALPRGMEQMAGHAGIQGANPYTMPAGQPPASGGRMGSGGVVPIPDVGGEPRPSRAAPVVPAPPPAAGLNNPGS